MFGNGVLSIDVFPVCAWRGWQQAENQVTTGLHVTNYLSQTGRRQNSQSFDLEPSHFFNQGTLHTITIIIQRIPAGLVVFFDGCGCQQAENL